MHVDRKKILAYISGKLSEEECFDIDIHLADCQQCAGRIKAFYNLRADPEESIKLGRANKLIESIYLLRLKQTLHRIASENHSLESRIKKWLGKISMKMEVAFGFDLNASMRKAQPLLEGVKALLSENAPLFAPVPVPSRILGTRFSSSVLSVEAKSELKPKITIDPVARKVLVEISYKKKPWPLAVIFSVESGEGFVKEFLHPEGTNFLLAEFSDIPDGPYVVVLEPEDQNGNRKTMGNIADH